MSSQPSNSINATAAPTPDGPPKLRPQIARYDAFFNQRNRRHELRKTRRPDEKGLSKKPILLVKRIINSRGQHEDTQVEIHHEALRSLLADIHRDVEGVDLTTKKPTTSRELFYYSHEKLAAKRQDLLAHDEPEDQDLIEGLNAAHRFIDEDLAGTISDVDTLISQGQITYSYLWALFRPSTHVYGYDSATDQSFVAYVAKEPRYVRSMKEGLYVVVHCAIIVHDDTGFGLARYDVKIPEFFGAFFIRELPIFPLELYADHQKVREKAIALGKVYANSSLSRMHFYKHHGTATLCVDNDEERASSGEKLDGRASGEKKLRINERVMIDVECFFENQSHHKLAQRKYNQLAPHVYRKLDPQQLSEEQFMICSPVLLGFCFNTKTWGVFAHNRVDEVNWSEEPFDGLVLGKKHKLLISSLVTEHKSQSTSFDDLVAGKGRGLVGLLCGNPGCGKTLTAEAVAEKARKPLLTVSAGELGTYSWETDYKLKAILRRGERWGAVVLLDEADVFLQERDKTDVSRNALVSIFLTQVEYNPGILIFTTNLIKQIDSAFESRIHFCVKYPDLDFNSRKTVWQTFLLRAGVSEKGMREHGLAHLARRPLNGRQIKNIVSTAKSIASSEDSSLTPKHVQTVLDVVQDWNVARSGRPSNLLLIVLGTSVVFALLYLRFLGLLFPNALL